MDRLKDKVAIVVGAAAEGNMGQAIAKKLAAEGAKVVVAGRHEEPLRRLAAEIGGGYHLCDMTRPDQIGDLVESCVAQHGPLDIGVNAAGWGLYRPFLDTTVDELRGLSELQFIGPFLLFQGFVRAMTEGGSIIAISTVSVRSRFDNHAAYSGSKAATDHVITCIANDFGHRGIRANSISPGFTDTPMASGFFAQPGIVDLFNAEIPLNRPGTPEDIANAALWLASDESSYVTGTNLEVNGGVFLRRLPGAQDIERVLASSSI